MILKSLSLQQFRNYKKTSFDFDPQTTVIVGPNAAGKTNLIEAIFMLSIGKSFRTDKEKQLMQFGSVVSRIQGKIGVADTTEEDTDLELVIAQSPQFVLQKKYLVNGVAKRRVDFATHLSAVLFTPSDLDIVAGQPGCRRKYLDEILEQVDMDYRLALSTYTKALRQRNALLEQVQKTGVRNEKLFSYWDDLLITNGQRIMQKREALLAYINKRTKDIFPFTMIYDKSVISEERLLQYKNAEAGAGVTLVGPHRDEVIIQSYHAVSKELEDVKYFSSRGQQRLVTLELKISQINYILEQSGTEPILILDDILSELDSEHIKHVLALAHTYQTIITTTHREFIVDKKISREAHVIELGSK